MSHRSKKIIINLVKYGAIAMVNTILSYGVYAVCVNMGMHYFIGSFLGYFVSTMSAFVLNTKYVFTPEGEEPVYKFKTMVKTFITYGFTGVVTYNIMLYLWIDICGISEMVAPLINIAINFPINYLMNKFWSYNDIKKERKIRFAALHARVQVAHERAQTARMRNAQRVQTARRRSMERAQLRKSRRELKRKKYDAA